MRAAAVASSFSAIGLTGSEARPTGVGAFSPAALGANEASAGLVVCSGHRPSSLGPLELPSDGISIGCIGPVIDSVNEFRDPLLRPGTLDVRVGECRANESAISVKVPAGRTVLPARGVSSSVDLWKAKRHEKTITER